MLFALGVLFWFVVMYVISIATIVDINSSSTQIVNNIIPQDRIAQKITRKIQSLNIDSSEISDALDSKTVSQKVSTSRSRLEDIKSFLSALMLGGQINDVQRERGELIESFRVASIKGDVDGETYVRGMREIVGVLQEKVDEIGELKLDALSKANLDEEQLRRKIDDYRQYLFEARTLSDEFSAQAAVKYAASARKIKKAAWCTSVTTSGVMVISTVLLILFTVWISRSIANPVKSIIKQIRSLGEGQVDLTKKIEISSRDEIGSLSHEFNELMEEIHNMATFKKVIEEDESLEDVYYRLGKVFNENFGLHDLMIYEVSNSKNKMKPVYPLLLNEKEIYCNEDILSNCDLCRAKKTSHTISSLAYPHMCKQFRRDLDKEHVCIPMIVGGSTGGVVQFLFKGKNIGDDHKDRRLFKAEQYMKESLSVIEAKRLMNKLRESSLKDPLTSLYNRRFLQEYTETLVAGVQRRGKSIGLIMCDLDYFKQVNDVYGHNVGDTVLKETALVIKKNVRDSDLVIRFGGEEFLVILLDINEGDTTQIAEKIRTNVQETKIKVPDGTVKKTISLGISEFPVDTESFWQAIKFADVALYKAKETGRNKYIRFTPDMWTEEQF